MSLLQGENWLLPHTSARYMSEVFVSVLVLHIFE